MKFTIVGDPHAKPGNLNKINHLFDMVETLGNTVIWLGDFLDTKEIIRGKCLNLIHRRLSESKLTHITPQKEKYVIIMLLELMQFS